MKHLTTLLTMVITFTGLAQQMPYNPDANGDDFVGVDDVLGVLGVYDTALMQPDLQCDYEGTELEQFFGALFSQTIVIDSIYIEYLFSDSELVFIPGCPEPELVQTVLERSYMLQPTGFYQGSYGEEYSFFVQHLDMSRWCYIYFFSNGEYEVRLYDQEIGVLTNYNEYSYATSSIPFPETWALDEDGIHVQFGMDFWPNALDFLRIIPFWHEAE